MMVSAKNLYVHFDAPGAHRAHAVDGVNIDIPHGQILALAGESGCGKTTLARALLGLQKPTSGNITIDGTPLSYRSKSLKTYRRHVQLILQDPLGALNPRHTVYEAVAEGPRIHRIPGNERDHVAEALSRAGLRPPERFFMTYPHQLSGGQRQRVVIAGALAIEPDILIADEPVASLDASVRGEILALLLQLRNELNLSALIVTHDLGLAWSISDQLAIMYLGRIVEYGPTVDILTRPAHPYTQALVSVLPDSAMPRTVLSGEPPDTTDIPTGCRFHPRCPALARGLDESVATACHTKALPILGSDTPGVACHLVASDASNAAQT